MSTTSQNYNTANSLNLNDSQKPQSQNSVYSSNLTESPTAAAILYLLKVQTMENKLSTDWTKQTVFALGQEADYAESQASNAIKQAKENAEAIRSEAYGLFASSAVNLGTAAAAGGMSVRSTNKEKEVDNKVKQDREYLDKIEKHDPDTKVSNKKGEEPKLKKLDRNLINPDSTFEEPYDPEEAGKASSKTSSKKEKNDSIQKMNAKQKEEAINNWKERIKTKEKQKAQIQNNLSTNLTLYVKPGGDSLAMAAQAGGKLGQAAHSAQAGKKESSKIIDQEDASLMQSTRSTAEQTDQSFLKKADQIPQLLAEIENANLFRA